MSLTMKQPFNVVALLYLSLNQYDQGLTWAVTAAIKALRRLSKPPLFMVVSCNSAR